MLVSRGSGGVFGGHAVRSLPLQGLLRRRQRRAKLADLTLQGGHLLCGHLLRRLLGVKAAEGEKQLQDIPVHRTKAGSGNYHHNWYIFARRKFVAATDRAAAGKPGEGKRSAAAALY